MRHCVIRCLIFLFIRSREEHSVVSVFPPLNQMGRKRSLLSVSCEQYFLQALDANNLMRPPASNFSQFPQQHWKPLLSTQAGIENRILMNTRNNTYLKNGLFVTLSHRLQYCINTCKINFLIFKRNLKNAHRNHLLDPDYEM